MADPSSSSPPSSSPSEYDASNDDETTNISSNSDTVDELSDDTEADHESVVEDDSGVSPAQEEAHYNRVTKLPQVKQVMADPSSSPPSSLLLNMMHLMTMKQPAFPPADELSDDTKADRESAEEDDSRVSPAQEEAHYNRVTKLLQVKQVMADLSSSSPPSSSPSEYDASDDDETTSISSSSDTVDELSDDTEADRESAEEDDSRVSPAQEEAHYNRVTKLLQGGRDLNILKLEECKAYLRKHGLRITGTKAICIARILEHWRIKDGSGEKLYPRSSFVINCRGDVCTGDVVLFTQKVYEKFDKVTRGGNPLGKRTIAGRIVKESYGAAKQQHTFTVEILWSKGVKRLPPLFPLLVKGRNLYRLRTYRQYWANEEERRGVLAEKHRRGAAARRTREIKKARSAKKGGHPRHARPSPKRQRKRKSRGPESKTPGPGMDRPWGNWKKQKTQAELAVATRHLQDNHQAYYNSGTLLPADYYYRHDQMMGANEPIHTGVHRGFGDYEVGSTSTASSIMAGSVAYANPFSLAGDPRVACRARPSTTQIRYNNRSQDSGMPLGGGSMQRRSTENNYQSPCSALGCQDMGARGCVNSRCSKCCMRMGRRCKRHKVR